jgi:hypothetical protein
MVHGRYRLLTNNKKEEDKTMPPRHTKLPTLLAAVLLTVCVAWPFSIGAQAKGRKGRAASRSRGASGKQLSSSGHLSKRHGRGRHSNNFAEDDVAVVPANYAVGPDRIEVIEYGTAPTPELARQLNPPPPRNPIETDTDSPSSPSPRRKGVSIDQSRVLQIQQALNQHGFYSGEFTGVYDENTIEAMRRFQNSEKIPATGYPTAHALKRLGLGSW